MRKSVNQKAAMSDAPVVETVEYEFQIIEIKVNENRDYPLFGKTYAYFRLTFDDVLLKPESFPTVENTTLEISDDSVTSVDYKFSLKWKPDSAYDPLV